jgi:tRNA(Arg) A34 adenosine deaminase TadA
MERRIVPIMPAGSGPCRKQAVHAEVRCTDGTIYEGSNSCLRPQPTCPRKGMPTGTGYELCVSICQQQGHAEVMALLAAGKHAQGGTLHVNGHTYACEACKGAARLAGIARLVVDGTEQPLAPTGAA